MSVRNQASIALKNSFKNGQNLLTAYNPGRQVELTQNRKAAYLGKAPTLGLVSKTFASGTATAWVKIQLFDLAEFSGCREKLSEKQFEELAMIICTDYGHYKLTQLMDFFRRFKAGEYGKFYGAVDPMAITCALKDFSDTRRRLLDKFMKEEKKAAALTDPTSARYRRQYAEQERIARFYSYNFRSTDFSLEEFREIWWLFNLGYERTDHGYDES